MVPSAQRARLAAYLRDAVAPAFKILPFDQTAAAWHGHERARLQALGLQPDLSDLQRTCMTLPTLNIAMSPLFPETN